MISDYCLGRYEGRLLLYSLIYYTENCLKKETRKLPAQILLNPIYIFKLMAQRST